jgi:predicted MPP superfamily phosphohydrolase
LNLKPLAWLAGGVGAGMLLYGAFVEAERLVVKRQTLRLPNWPTDLNGYTIALLGDFHLRDQHTLALTKRAVDAALDARPNMVVLAGDFVGYWKLQSPWLIGEALAALESMNGNVIAVPGNHDYWGGDASLLTPICEELGIRLLRNESVEMDDIEWIGIDSLNSKRADPEKAFASSELGARNAELREESQLNTQNSAPPDLHPSSLILHPSIALWHEPDAVRYLPPGCDLMLSGHSHGGQFVFPGGFAPMTSRNGRKYRGGFYPNAPTPLYVTQGIGTTGPPSRFLCPPEVVILTITNEG